MKSLPLIKRFFLKTHSFLPRSFKPFSTINEYFNDFEFVPPFMVTNPEIQTKYNQLITDLKANTLPIQSLSDLNKLIQIFRRTRGDDLEFCRQLALRIKKFLMNKDTDLMGFLECFNIFAGEKPHFAAIAKEVFLKDLVQKFSEMEITSYNINQAAGLCYFILLFEIGFKEFYEFLQNPLLDEKVDKNITKVLLEKFDSFHKQNKMISEENLVELLQSYLIVMRSFDKMPEYKTFFYCFQNKIYKNLKGFSTPQLTILGILYSINHIIQRNFWEGLEEEVHFRINEWNISHLMKVCDCFMSVKEGSLSFFNEIQKFFMNNIECINLEEIPSFIQILVQDEKIMDPFLSQLEIKILLNFDFFDGNQLSRILWCFSLRKILNEELYGRIEKKLLKDFKEVNPFELVLALYAIKFSKNQSQLLETAKVRVNEIIDQSNSDHEILMGLLYVYCENLKNEEFFQKLEKAIENMISQCTPTVFMNFLRLCIQIHKDKENLFEERVYLSMKERYKELEKHYRDDEKLEVKESFKYLNIKNDE